MKQSEEAILYLVPTPIGNLEDITLRSLRILKEVSVILAEDTRTTGVLLKHYAIKTPLQSYHIFNEHQTIHKIIERLAKNEKIALVSDAGTPAISDPGFLLVREVLKNQYKVECLPGATAFVPALVKSGFPTDKFIFEGFLPVKKGRKTRLEILASETRTMVFYESPHRIIKTLNEFCTYFGNERLASVSRELTKFFEETINDTLINLHQHFEKNNPKGEFVIVIEGKEIEKKSKKYENKDEEE
ncbi:MAG: 16S rRNA (cytidine(1402)-2'-O)-methyltransferase [Cytophagia bacterium]|nr:MAG: 16S rRNA (cytidine(1402)-2'-O)-methyltransferase [Cytophagales bacterium]TAG02908.1 MAG: 16S rRNA (cytidine(1402)-2'-O)-methyltransferase [Cytophagia bacterium]TAG42083.1 MAG: 16S rRNA (cytidine(1402)-2'-O)-methyltransferase [Cytophagia bacterium]TAH29063.1 MAG: 16S rRNA (cytidine(1402)-2'-O)-methyltransferase [Cytophagales bacterium]